MEFQMVAVFFIRISPIYTKITIIIYRLIPMCGRLFQTLPLHRLLRIARTSNVSNQQFHSISFNVCPTTYIPVIRKSKLYATQDKQQQSIAQHKSLDQKINQALKEDGADPQADSKSQDKKGEENNDRQLTYMKWGQKTNFNMIINGRIEELSSKRTFMKIIQNRCVVIMQGYYQWKSKEEPFCFRPKNSDHFLVAGLYTDDNQIIILTKDATSELAFVHERMPVILTPGEVQLWLDPKNTKDINVIIQKSLTNKSKPIWKNIGFAKLAPHVNKREEKSIKCLMTIEEYKKQLDSKGLMRFWKKKDPVQTVGKQGQTLKQKAGDQKQIKTVILKKDPANVSQSKQENQNITQKQSSI